MKNLKTSAKLNIIFLPFLAITALTIGGYTFLRWLVDIHLRVLPLKPYLLDFAIPLAFALLVVLFGLRRRVKILKMTKRGERDHFFAYVVMTAAMATPLIILQNYVTRAAYPLIPLGGIEELSEYPTVKYVQLDTFQLSPTARTFYATARVYGSRNDELRYTIFMAVPFNHPDSTVWYGIRMKETIDNNSSDAVKERRYQQFREETLQKLEKYAYYDLDYFERLGNSDDRDGFLQAIKHRYPDVVLENQVILIPILGLFEERLEGYLFWACITFIVGAFGVFAIVLNHTIDEDALVAYLENTPDQEDSLMTIQLFLNPFGQYPTAALLILLNLLVFSWMILAGVNVFSPTAKELLEFGGLRRNEVLEGEYWRLLSSMFVHAGGMHLAVNMVSLGYCIFLLREKILPLPLGLVYVACGLMASVCSLYWHEDVVSVGASGAIFGFYGVILVYTLFGEFSGEMKAFAWYLLIGFGLFSLFLGVVSSGVDHAGHVGGLFAGIFSGLSLYLANRLL